MLSGRVSSEHQRDHCSAAIASSGKPRRRQRVEGGARRHRGGAGRRLAGSAQSGARPPEGSAVERARDRAQPPRPGPAGRALRRAACRARRYDHPWAVRLRHHARLSGQQPVIRRAPVAGRRRRLRPRNARAAFRHRSPLPLSLEADRLVGERHRIHPLHALGPAAEGRPRDAHRARDAEGGARRHDHTHRAAGGASSRRRPRPLRRIADAIPERSGRRHGARNSSPPSLPNATRGSRASASRATWSSRTSRKERAASATCRPCSGSPSTITASAPTRRWSTPGCCRGRNTPCSCAAPISSGRCAAICISSPGGPRSGCPSICSRNWPATSATRSIRGCTPPSG